MDAKISLYELRTEARRAGLNLSEAELQKLLPGVNRSQKQVLELRRLMSDSVEPAGIFSAAKSQKE